MSGEYLVPAVNGMYNLLVQPEPKTSDLYLAAYRGCDVLNQISDDQSFFRDMEGLEQPYPGYQRDLGIITGSEIQNIENLRQLLEIERRVLLLGGLDYRFVNILIAQTQVLVNEIGKGKYSTSILQRRIKFLRDRTCLLSEKLHDATEDEQNGVHANSRISENQASRANKSSGSQNRSSRKQIMRIAFSLGGFAVCALNYSAMAKSIFSLYAPSMADIFDLKEAGPVLSQTFGSVISGAYLRK